MKAMVYTEYGPPEVLALKEVEKPAVVALQGLRDAGPFVNGEKR